MKRRTTLLRHLRRSRELSVHALAKATGVNVSTISLAERGLAGASEKTLDRLARYFKVPPDDLLKEPIVQPAQVAS